MNSFTLSICFLIDALIPFTHKVTLDTLVLKSIPLLFSFCLFPLVIFFPFYLFFKVLVTLTLPSAMYLIFVYLWFVIKSVSKPYLCVWFCKPSQTSYIICLSINIYIYMIYNLPVSTVYCFK